VHPGQPFSGNPRATSLRYRRDDAVIARPRWEAGWYRERGAERPRHRHRPNLLPLPPIAREPETILFVGRKERYKGYHALRTAADIVWRERPNARFIAVGQAAWTARFSRLPRDARWEELGVVSEDVKASGYARASIFAMPSDHETFGHTYLEGVVRWPSGHRGRHRAAAGGRARGSMACTHARAAVDRRCDPRAASRSEARRQRWVRTDGARVQRDFTWPIVAKEDRGRVTQ
jgi:glycosyltransferase involved in cell wall biosynthesis